MEFIAILNSISQNNGLDFLIIGGFAVVHHGYPRETADLDLLIRKSARQDWLGLFTSLGYQVVRDGDVFLQLSPSDANMWPVDLMLVNDSTFDKMQGQAVEAGFHGTLGPIPSAEHLLALKVHALKNARIHRFLKDFQDVEGIIRKNQFDLNSETIRQIILKYGSVELYEKIRRACSND